MIVVRSLRKALTVGPWVLLALVSVVAEADRAEAQTTRPEIVSLTFEGNESFSARALSNAIITRQTRCRATVFQPFCWFGADFSLDPGFLASRTLRDDYFRVQLFYYQRGFRETQVDTTVSRHDDGTADVHFRIREGRPVVIVSLDFLGLEELDPDARRAVTADLPVSEGDPLNLLALDATRDTIRTRLWNRNYAHADVYLDRFIPDGTYDAEVAFDVYTGPRVRFGPITVVGNEKVDETVIRRMLPFEEGTPYSQELIFAGQRNLFGLEILRHASIQQDRDHFPDSIVPVEVRVNEGSTHRVRTGAGWSTADCFNTDNRWSSRNFFGGARRLVLRGRVSNLLTPSFDDSLCSQAGTGVYADVNWLASAEFTQPWIFSPRNAFSAAVFFERQSLQDVFVRQAVGANLGLTRNLGRATPLTLSYRPQRASLDAAEIFFCTSFLVCDPVDIDVLEAPNQLSPVALSLSRDRRNQPLAPTTGYNLLVDLEHASEWTGSDFAYERLIAEASRYEPLDGGIVLAGRLRGGWLNTGRFSGTVAGSEGLRVDHPQKRFFSGGSNNVRGFAQNQLGPRVLSVGVGELVGPRPEGDGAVCTPEEVLELTCNAGALQEGRFHERPTGGSAVLEGNAELRFLFPGSAWGGAAFMDFGQVWNEPRDFSFSALELTPGIGVRYNTPIGPVRMDIAYRFAGIQHLPVVTSQLRPFDPDRDPPASRIPGPDGDPLDYVLSDELALLGPRVPFGEDPGFSFRRFQLHFSIGEAF